MADVDVTVPKLFPASEAGGRILGGVLELWGVQDLPAGQTGVDQVVTFPTTLGVFASPPLVNAVNYSPIALNGAYSLVIRGTTTADATFDFLNGSPSAADGDSKVSWHAIGPVV
jgi:hypothetical protein